MRDIVDALSVEHVSHAYGARLALDDVSFTVKPGSFSVLLGLNGAGKSTLFSVVTHLYAPKAGVVRIFGHDVARESGPALSRLGVVFQSRTLDPDLSVEQNLAYHAALQGMTGADRRARQKILLERVGLSDRLRDKARHLSGGQARRIEIARALLHRPKLILLDEPTAGLDIKARADVLAIVRELAADEGVGVLWTTHLVDEIRDEDHVIVLHKGRVRADATSGELIAQAGVAGVGDAFTRLTGARAQEDAET